MALTSDLTKRILTNQPIVALILTFVVVLTIKAVLLIEPSPNTFPLFFITAIIACLPFAKVTYPTEQPSYSILIRGISLLLGAYALTNYQGYVFDSEHQRLAHEVIR